jgi:hypothetical protein
MKYVKKTEMRRLLQSTRSRLLSAFLLHEGWNVNDSEHDSAVDMVCYWIEAVVVHCADGRNSWRFANQPVAVRTIFGILYTCESAYCLLRYFFINDSKCSLKHVYHPFPTI